MMHLKFACWWRPSGPVVTAALALAFSCAIPASADSPPQIEEDATGFTLGDRLVVRPVFEYEWFNDRLRTQNGRRFRESGTEGSFDLGFELRLTEHIDTTLNFSYDLTEPHGYLDEYTIGWSGENAALIAGLQTLPFPENDSYFISDSLTRFAELDSESIVIEYEVSDSWAFETGLYGNPSESIADRDSDLDVTAMVEVQVTDTVTFELGVMSDLADGNDVLDLDDPAPRESSTPAFGAAARWTLDDFELSAELVKATRDIPGVENNVNRPRAWAFQAAWFPHSDLDVALRAEGSSELFDAPRRNYGFAVTWRFHPNATLAFEVMRGQYAKEFVFDDDDNGFDRNRRSALQLTVRF